MRESLGIIPDNPQDTLTMRGSSETKCKTLSFERKEIVRPSMWIEEYKINIEPTPVSALIHAATMVTAGIFLIIRSSPLLEMSNTALFYITIIGALTAFFAASVALVQNDLKKVIAYSTASQLGYISISYQDIKWVGKRHYSTRRISGGERLIDILPQKDEYIERCKKLTPSTNYKLKSRYIGQSVIYLWRNNLNGRQYVGRTINFSSRLNNYFNQNYLIETSNMPICYALLKYGDINLELYILESHQGRLSREMIASRENYWFKKLNPSYNLASILDTFKGENHPRYGREVSLETRNKISEKLLGRKLSRNEIDNHILGARKKPVYCYDLEKKNLIMTFAGQRIMARELGVSLFTIQSYLNQDRPFHCQYQEQKYSWYLTSAPL